MPLPEHFDIDQLTVNLDELTLDDLDAIEELTGAPFTAIGQNINAKTLRALAFVSLRRDYPDITTEDVGRLKVKIDKPDPTAPASS